MRHRVVIGHDILRSAVVSGSGGRMDMGWESLQG